MSLLSPKTIVITAYPGKQSSVSMSNSDFSILDTSDSFDCGGGPKKRRRLTHLTQDEKLLRRKLKNRVAAQTARDRKKALMTDLEEKLALLEEENKLLRKQNDTLRETSKTLVVENKSLKSRLSEQSVPEVGTESEASRSAEGTSQDFVPAPGSVLHICGDTQHDNVISILQKVSADFSSSQTQTTTSSASRTTDLSNTSPSRNRSPRVVGLSPAELESLNELIHIDHVYFKPQPSVQYKDKPAEVVLTSSTDIVHQVNNTSESALIVQQADNDITFSPISTTCKRDSSGNIIISSTTAQPMVVADSSSPPYTVDDRDSLDVSSIAEDLVNSISDSDIDSPLDLFQSLEFTDLLGENCGVNLDVNVIDQDKKFNIGSDCVSNSNFSHQDLNSSVNIKTEMDTQKLFDEIYDNFLVVKNSSSPDSGNLSDSGVGSDVGEALSPQHSEGSLLDDYPWQDSFTDLFPDLQ